MVARSGYNGDPVFAAFQTDANFVSYTVSFGFFIIVLIQLIANVLGDKTPISVTRFQILTIYIL